MTKQKAKPLYFRLTSDDVRDNCVKAVFLAHQDSAEVLEVVIQPESKKRSLAQNRIYWAWITQWSNKQGWDEEYSHHFFKYKFLVRIFYKDDAKYAEMCDAVKALKDIEHESYRNIAAHVIKQTSTTDASVQQMKNYLDQIERYCYAKDFMLTVPDQLQWARD